MPAGRGVRGIAQEANGGTAFRLVARLRASSRCIHAEGRSPAAGTRPGIAFRQTALARIPFRPMGLREPALRPVRLRWVAVRPLALAPPPLRPLGFPRPTLRLLVRLPARCTPTFCSVGWRTPLSGTACEPPLAAGSGPDIGFPLLRSRLIAVRRPLLRAVVIGSLARGRFLAFRPLPFRSSRFRSFPFRCAAMRFFGSWAGSRTTIGRFRTKPVEKEHCRESNLRPSLLQSERQPTRPSDPEKFSRRGSFHSPWRVGCRTPGCERSDCGGSLRAVPRSLCDLRVSSSRRAAPSAPLCQWRHGGLCLALYH